MAAKKNSFEKCRELIIEAEDAVSCPCCFEKSEIIVQCNTGHHICNKCMTKLNGKCPTCRNNFSGTKNFAAQSVGKTLTNLKELLDDITNDESASNCSGEQYLEVTKMEAYRREVKTFLYDHSRLFQTLGSTLACFNQYLENPSGPRKHQLQREFSTITDSLKKIELKMNSLESGLKNLNLKKI